MDHSTAASFYFSGTTRNDTENNQNNSVSLRDVTSIAVTCIIVVGMFGMGCGIEVKKLWKHVKKPVGVSIGIGCQFAIMPLMAFLLAKIFNMNAVRTLILMVMGSCPGGTTSNVAVVWIDGDVDLSVAMTTASSILAFGLMPLLLWIYSFGFGTTLQVPFDSIAISLCTILFPCIFGIAFRWKFPKVAGILLKVLASVGLLSVIAIAILTLITYINYLQMVVGQYVSAAVLPVLGMFLGYVIASLVGLYEPLKLKEFQKRTVAMEIGVQNVQLTSGIIYLSDFTFEEESQVSLFPTIYFASQTAWVFLFVLLYKIYHKIQSKKKNFDLDSKEIENEKSNSSYINTNFDVDIKCSPPKYDEVADETKGTKL